MCPSLPSMPIDGKVAGNYALNEHTFGRREQLTSTTGMRKLSQVPTPSARMALSEPQPHAGQYYSLGRYRGVISLQGYSSDDVFRHNGGKLVNAVYCDGHAGSVMKDSIPFATDYKMILKGDSNFKQESFDFWGSRDSDLTL